MDSPNKLVILISTIRIDVRLQFNRQNLKGGLIYQHFVILVIDYVEVGINSLFEDFFGAVAEVSSPVPQIS
jgi:hypothetical protein